MKYHEEESPLEEYLRKREMTNGEQLETFEKMKDEILTASINKYNCNLKKERNRKIYQYAKEYGSYKKALEVWRKTEDKDCKAREKARKKEKRRQKREDIKDFIIDFVIPSIVMIAAIIITIPIIVVLTLKLVDLLF